ncbi:MAG: proline--tRNA ligase [Clostridia bacterium]
MRLSKSFFTTLRETPTDAEVVSHQLLVRGGFIRRVATGTYSYLPLGWRVMTKIMQIVKDEMAKSDAEELMLPILHPAELWQESGRWNVYGKELMRMKDRFDREYCLAPTAEEVITDLVRKEVNSYKQLPLNLYQIQNKYRDERRPRFGLMRSREFLMKDGYSFDCDEAGLEVTYQKMYQAYCNIFSRCGMNYRPVEADNGAIGGSKSHEFMALATSGEAEVVYCQKCDYAANVEQAISMRTENESSDTWLALKKVNTENNKTIDEVARFLQIKPSKLIKSLIYKTNTDEFIAVLLRGDREVNEVKLINIIGCLEVSLAEEQDIVKLIGTNIGFIGPLGMKNIKVYCDFEIVEMKNAVAGANEFQTHLINVNYGRDFSADYICDLRLVGEGDSCPNCGEPLTIARGIEVGQVFKLGTKYSESLNANYLDDKGVSHPMLMGCYGIGIGRTMAATIEQNSDEKGIIWPITIAPYQIIIVPVNIKDTEIMNHAENIYSKLNIAGVEAVLDDRDERAGVKFADADLIGYPLRLTVGKKTLTDGTVDLKIRNTGEEIVLALDDIVSIIDKKIAELLRGSDCLE